MADNRRQIVECLARRQRVEELVRNIAHARELTPDLKDLVQMVYQVLLTYNEAAIQDLDESGQMDFFIVRVVQNQLNSTHSPYWHQVRKFGRRSKGLEDYQKGEEGSDD